jgi:hypothetical protein
MSDDAKQAGHRKWRTDGDLMALPGPEAYPNRRGNVPRELFVQRLNEVYLALINDVPLGRIKREMSRKWSAERPDYPAKPRSVERYITKAQTRLNGEYDDCIENYWPRTIAYWRVKVSSATTERERTSAKKQLDGIMMALSVKKVALTDTKGNDVVNPFTEAAKQMTDEQLKAVAAMRNLAQGATQPN